MIFGKQILTDAETLSNEFLDPVKNSDNSGVWKAFIKTIMIGATGIDTTIVFQGSQPQSLKSKYEKQKSDMDKAMFTLGYDTDKFKLDLQNYRSDFKNKTRTMYYQKQDPLNQTDGDKLLKLWQSVSVNDNEFNFKKEYRG